MNIIKLTHSELNNLSVKELNGIYITEKGTFYYVNGKPHREDGPAFEYTTGVKQWYYNNLWHRLDGPALILANGYTSYYIYGVPYSKEEYEVEAYLIKNKLKNYE